MVVFQCVSFDMPSAECVNEAIHRFLRTSEFGGWDVDNTRPNDPFALNFRRGEALPPPPGKLGAFVSGNSDYGKYVRRSGWAGNPPMELTVMLRPIKDQRIRVQLEYRLIGPHAELVFKVRNCEEIGKEILAMIVYLRDCFGFFETELVAKSSADRPIPRGAGIYAR